MRFIKSIAPQTLLFALTMAGCSEKETLLEFNQAPSVYIVKPGIGVDTTVYSFALRPASVTNDTVYLSVQVSGKLSNTDRPLLLQADANSTAVASTHYKFLPYSIPAGKNRADLPVVVYRTPDLKSKTVFLKINLQPTADFKLFKETVYDSVYTFTINDILSRPLEWGTNSSSSYFAYFGAYSRVKYQLIIDATGKYDFMNPPLTSGEWFFYKAQARNALNAYNNANPSNPLRDENGALITFPN